jgi:hypothetical protein
MAALTAQYVDMCEPEIPGILGERLTVAAVLADLCTLAGEPIPPAVLASIGAHGTVMAVPS